MNLTYYGHSCFGIKVNGFNLVFDPFILANPLNKTIKLSDVKADYILVSHGHDDHTADLVALAKQTGAKVITNWEIHSWLNKQGVSNTHPMNIGGSWTFEFGKVKCANAVHSSSFEDGTYAGNPMGFIIESSEGNFYYSGDTALTLDMKLIGEYKSIDFALLPIGGNFTMNVDNALIAADYIKCNKIVGMHFDTFGYIVIDKAEAKQKFQNEGRELFLPELGQNFNV